MNNNPMLRDISQLSKDEKLLLVEALWNSISSTPEQVEIPTHHKDILEQRLRSLDREKEDLTCKDVNEKYLLIAIPKSHLSLLKFTDH
ncbi:MAG: hypothetical protein FH748_14600 [Balneolaceae bacterium]|nr:hypothetical protein [Balneolaceae bacterium]